MQGDSRRRAFFVEGIDHRRERPLQRGRDEVIRIVFQQRDLRRGLGQYLAGEIRRDVEHAVDAPVAQVRHRLLGVAVLDGLEGPGVGGDGAEHLAQLHGLKPVVLIHHADHEVLDDAPEGVPEDHQLHQRKDRGHDHEDRAAPEPPQVALQNGQDAMHVC